MVFYVGIKHADLLAEAYKNAGFTARSLHSKSQESDAEIIDYFKKGYIKVLVSVSKLTTGFDVPSADCAVIARPTKSQNLYKQMVGRILRLSPETHKTHAVLLDCGNVIDELGDPLAPIKATENNESNNKMKCSECQSENLKLKKSNDEAFWECQGCGHHMNIKEKTYKCNYCGKNSDNESEFIFTQNKLSLLCQNCDKETVISEFFGTEEMVSLDGEEYDFNKKVLSEHSIERLYGYIRNNNYIDFSKYLNELTQTYDIDFKNIVNYSNQLRDKSSGLNNYFKYSFYDSYFSMLAKSNTTKYFNLLDCIIEKYNIIEYLFLNNVIQNDWYNVEKYLLDTYKFQLETIFDSTFITESSYGEDNLLDFCKYELTNDDIESDDEDISLNIHRNCFFQRNAYLWKTFEAQAILSKHSNTEKEEILPYLDYYFGKYNIDIQVFGKKNNFKFLPFWEAKKFVQKLTLKSYREWEDYTNMMCYPKFRQVPLKIMQLFDIVAS